MGRGVGGCRCPKIDDGEFYGCTRECFDRCGDESGHTTFGPQNSGVFGEGPGGENFYFCNRIQDKFSDGEVAVGTFEFSGAEIPSSWTRQAADWWTESVLESDGEWIYPTGGYSSKGCVYLTGIVANNFLMTFTGTFDQDVDWGDYAQDIHWFLTARNVLSGYFTFIVPQNPDLSDPIRPDQIGIEKMCEIVYFDQADSLLVKKADDLSVNVEYQFSLKREGDMVSLITPTSQVDYPTYPKIGPLMIGLGFWRDLGYSGQIPKVKNIHIEVKN